MARGSAPQLPMSFARPRKKKGGLVIHDYRESVERLRADATRVAEHFELPPFELDADRPDARDRYGVLEEKKRAVARQLDRGEVVILFDPESETCNIVPKDPGKTQ